MFDSIKKLALATVLVATSMTSTYAADSFMFRPPVSAVVLSPPNAGPGGGSPVDPRPPESWDLKISMNGLTLVSGQPVGNNVMPAVTGSAGTLTFSYSALPAGLSFDPSNGRLSGTPAQTGNFDPIVTVTDTYKTWTRFASQYVSMSIAAPATNGLAIKYETITVPVGIPFETRVSPLVSNRSPNSELTLVFTDLPGSVCACNVNFGTLKGTIPAAGTYNVTVEVREKNFVTQKVTSATSQFQIVATAAPDTAARYYRLTAVDKLAGARQHGSEIVFFDAGGANLSAAARSAGQYAITTNRFQSSTEGLQNGITTVPQEVVICGSATCDVGMSDPSVFIVDFGSVAVTPKRIELWSTGHQDDRGHPLFYDAAYNLRNGQTRNVLSVEKSNDGVTWFELTIPTPGLSMNAPNGQGLVWSKAILSLQ